MNEETIKKKIDWFLNDKDGQKALLYIGIGILIILMWRALFIIGLVVLLFLAIRNFSRKKEQKPVKVTIK